MQVAQLALTMLLSFALLAGQRLCCCTIADSAVRLTAGDNGGPADCCCSTSTDDASDSAPCSPNGACPCKKNGAIDRPVAPASIAASADHGLLDPCDEWMSAVFVSLSPIVAVGAGAKPRSFANCSTGRDILCITHILTC